MTEDALFLHEDLLSLLLIPRFIKVPDREEIGDQVGHLLRRQGEVFNAFALYFLPHLRRMVPHQARHLDQSFGKFLSLPQVWA